VTTTKVHLVLVHYCRDTVLMHLLFQLRMVIFSLTVNWLTHTEMQERCIH